jgi:hypothetical protein
VITRAAISVFVALAGCGDGQGGDISYTSNDKPIGTWTPQMQSGKAGSSDEGNDVTSSQTSEKPTKASNLEMAAADAATDSESDAGADVSEQKPVTPTATKPTAPASKDAGGPAPRVTFSVLTEVQHMRLAMNDPKFDDDARGPKNMGAIWISKPDGTFVRSLEVWRLHKERSRHLQAFNKACDCPKPDVIATATLNKHKQHTVNWDLSAHDGTKAPEGKYTLHIEVADYDVDNPDKPDKTAMNAVWSMDFDTHDAPKASMPDAAQYYTNLKLELFAP